MDVSVESKLIDFLRQMIKGYFNIRNMNYKCM